jgi:predicted RNA-binding protein YlxR (DUF448 family)
MMTQIKQIRTCLVSKQKKPKGDLVRFVVRDGILIWDYKQILSGRGGYVVPEACVISKLPKMEKKVRHFLKCSPFKISPIDASILV